MKALPYLNFGGNCREAFEYYHEVLGGTLDVRAHGESPMAGEVPADWHDLVLHARLVRGDLVLMASDSPPDRFEPARGLFVSLQVADPDEAERIFAALADGGEVTMPMDKTFWAERFGMLTDRFGTPWMVNCDPELA